MVVVVVVVLGTSTIICWLCIICCCLIGSSSEVGVQHHASTGIHEEIVIEIHSLGSSKT